MIVSLQSFSSQTNNSFCICKSTWCWRFAGAWSLLSAWINHLPTKVVIEISHSQNQSKHQRYIGSQLFPLPYCIHQSYLVYISLLSLHDLVSPKQHILLYHESCFTAFICVIHFFFTNTKNITIWNISTTRCAKLYNVALLGHVSSKQRYRGYMLQPRGIISFHLQT